MEMVQPFLAILAVLALLGGSLWWLRHKGVAQFGVTNRARRMEVVERLPLSAQHSLYLVRVDQRNILLALSPSGCGVLETSLPGGRPEASR